MGSGTLVILNPGGGDLEKFNFISLSCLGIFSCLSLPLTTPEVWFWACVSE